MYRLFLSLLIGFSLFCGIEAAYGDVKIGYIDSEILKEQIPELRQVRRQLEQLQQEYERDMADRESKLLKYQEDFRKQELLMSEKRKAEMQAEFEKKMRELQEFGQQKFGPEGELMKKNISLSEPIFEQINQAIKGIAEEEGYDYIFDVAGSASIVYAKESHNLTEQLIGRLQEEKKGTNTSGR